MKKKMNFADYEAMRDREHREYLYNTVKREFEEDIKKLESELKAFNLIKEKGGEEMLKNDYFDVWKYFTDKEKNLKLTKKCLREMKISDFNKYSCTASIYHEWKAYYYGVRF